MMARDRRYGKSSMKTRVGIATALLVGGAVAAGAVVASNHGAAATATSAAFSSGYNGNMGNTLNLAMNNWNGSRQSSYTALAGLTQVRQFGQTTHQGVSARGRYAAFQFVGWALRGGARAGPRPLRRGRGRRRARPRFGAADNTPFDAGVYGLQMFALRREQGRLGEVAPCSSWWPRARSSSRCGARVWPRSTATSTCSTRPGASSRRSPPTASRRARDSVWPTCATFLAEVCLRLGDVERAALLYDELTPYSGRNLMVGMTICFGPADRFLAGLAALLGRGDDAEAHFAGRGGPGRAQRLAGVDRARVARPRRPPRVVWRPAACRQLGARAHQLAVVLGMRRARRGARAGSLRRRVARARGDRPRPRPALPDGLSAREVDVLRLVADGRSNREVGEALFISQNTVANHVRAILQKTGCANRAEAAVYAARHQLLEL